MKLIIGLGNPDEKYSLTRHNIGFMTVKNIQEEIDFPDFTIDQKFNSLISKSKFKGGDVILALPLTYMNNSGIAVQKISNFYKIDSKNCIVISDDLDLKFGEIKIKKNGSGGTHNGLKSIVNYIGNDFPRIKIGIENRNKEDKIETSSYVLSNFNKEELKKLENIIIKATEATLFLIDDEINKAMNKYN